MKTYFNSKGFITQLYELGIYWDRKVLSLQQDCTGKYSVFPLSMGFVEPMEFNSDSIYPTQGVWTTRFKFDRCNESIVYNAIFMAQKGKKPKIGLLVPGNTRTSPQLMRDLYSQGVILVTEIKRKNKECKEIRVLNTEVTKEPFSLKSDGKTFHGAWEEQWTVKNCDEIIEMTFCFIPTDDGGTNWSSGKCK